MVIRLSDEDLSKAANVRGQLRIVEIKQRLQSINTDEIHDADFKTGSILSITDEKSEGLYSRTLVELFSRAYNDIDSILSYDGNVTDFSSAAYLLARSSIEISSYANWLMSIEKDRDRAFQTYKLVYQNFKNIKQIFEEAKETDVSEFAELGMGAVAQLMEKNVHGKGTHRLENPTPYSTIIGNADKIFSASRKRGIFPGLMAWRMCSAVVHGNSFFNTAFLKLEVRGANEHKAKRMVARYSSMAVTLLPAVENLEFFAHQYKTQCINQNIEPNATDFGG